MHYDDDISGSFGQENSGLVEDGDRSGSTATDRVHLVDKSVLGEERDIQLPAHFTLKIEPYSPLSKAQGKTCVLEDILREERDVKPAHFTIKIESYPSLLDVLDGPLKRYESGIFDSGGYKWKLVLYPNGKKTCEGKGHISLYLAVDESSFPSDNQAICVNFKLFVLNQNTMKYLTIQDANKGAMRYFDKLRNEQGYTQFLPLDKFNDPCNGYLVNDCCAFGAEVFVIQPSSGREETVTMVKAPNGNIHTWSIKNFLKLNDDVQYSAEFTVGERKWELQLYPKGDRDRIKGKFLSVFLALADWESVSPKREIYAKVKIRVLDQYQLQNTEKSMANWFGKSSSATSWGWAQFMPLEDIYKLSNGYLKDDTLTVEAEFDVISVVK